MDDDLYPPTLDEIERIARATVAGFPDSVRSHAEAVEIVVADFPEDDILAEIGVEDPFELTGLYEGIPLPEKSPDNPFVHPDRVWLFRRPILDEWVGRGEIGLTQLVFHVTVHEFAHHFGWTDDDIATIAPWRD